MILFYFVIPFIAGLMLWLRKASQLMATQICESHSDLGGTGKELSGERRSRNSEPARSFREQLGV